MRNVPSVELKSLPYHLIYNLWWTHNRDILGHYHACRGGYSVGVKVLHGFQGLSKEKEKEINCEVGLQYVDSVGVL
jgi:hypothetical protein